MFTTFIKYVTSTAVKYLHCKAVLLCLFQHSCKAAKNDKFSVLYCKDEKHGLINKHIHSKYNQENAKNFY